jgi:large subunit ribosomal protein L18
MTTLLASKNAKRQIRHKRIRASVKGTETRPRLAVFKSNKFVSVQLIDDTKGTTIATAHGREFKGSQSVQSEAVGKAIAERAKKLKITAVVFDRGGYRYGGLIKSLADAARAGGLTF